MGGVGMGGDRFAPDAYGFGLDTFGWSSGEKAELGATEPQPIKDVIPGIIEFAKPAAKFSVLGSSGDDAELKSILQGRQQAFKRGFSTDVVAIRPQIKSPSGLAAGVAQVEYYENPTDGDESFALREAYAQVFAPGRVRPSVSIRLGQQDTWSSIYTNNEWTTWFWNDRPLVYTRLFGGSADGMGVTVAVANQHPTVAVRLLAGAFNLANNETGNSAGLEGGFVVSDPIGGYSFDEHESDFFDFGYMGRASVASSGLFGGCWAGEAYASALIGTNATGSDGNTLVYGGGMSLTLVPSDPRYSWGFSVEAEYLRRDLHADAQGAAPEADLEDWGGYVSAVLDVPECADRLPGAWSFGLRYDFVSGAGDGFGPEFVRELDPGRTDHSRWSALAFWSPGPDIPLLRALDFYVQYAYDDKDTIDKEIHSVTLGFQVK